MTQPSGTKAVTIESRRAPPHAARHDTAERRATLMNAGSRIKNTTVPMRPVATAPIAAGSRAYAAAATMRTSRLSMTRRRAR